MLHHEQLSEELENAQNHITTEEPDSPDILLLLFLKIGLCPQSMFNRPAMMGSTFHSNAWEVYPVASRCQVAGSLLFRPFCCHQSALRCRASVWFSFRCVDKNWPTSCLAYFCFGFGRLFFAKYYNAVAAFKVHFLPGVSVVRGVYA